MGGKCEAMAAKRPAPDGSGGPPAKKISLVFSPLDIGPAGGEEDLNIKVLQVKKCHVMESACFNMSSSLVLTHQCNQREMYNVL